MTGEIVALVAAHEEGFNTGRSLPHLIENHRPLLVFGSAGRNSLRGKHLGAFRKSAYLVSVTSRTYEFVAVARRVVDYGRLGHAYLMDGGIELCLVGHGMPINFYHAESMPNRYIDLVISLLLLGGVTLARPDQGGFEPGHNVERTNAVLNTSPALETYYDWYGEPSARRDLLTPGTKPPTSLARCRGPSCPHDPTWWPPLRYRRVSMTGQSPDGERIFTRQDLGDPLGTLPRGVLLLHRESRPANSRNLGDRWDCELCLVPVETKALTEAGLVAVARCGTVAVVLHPGGDADSTRLALAFALHLDASRRHDLKPVRPCVISRYTPRLPRIH